MSVVIVGGGPAGCGAAKLLMHLGHRVVLIDRPAADHASLAESIPPSARKPLAAVGLLDAVETAGFHPWRGNTVWWAGREPRIEAFPPGVHGYQVIRRDLARRLLDDVTRAGATVVAGTVVDVVRPGGDPGGAREGPSVLVNTGLERTRLSADYVLDCSGRAGVIARRGFREPDTSHHTIALAGVWRRDTPWPVEDDSHTLVASYADGWAWSVPTGSGVRHFTVMVDPQRTARGGASASHDVYRGELAKVEPFQPILDGATCVEGPWGADASLHGARQYAGPGFVLVGDAASCINTLSSYGVKKALASAWLAAVAVHTALTRPAMADEALAFFDRRERAVYAAARRQAAAFALPAAEETAHPFWTSRALSPDGFDELGGAGVIGDPDVSALAGDPDVLKAFAMLRAQATLRVVMAPDVRIAPRAAVVGHEIVHQEHLFLQEWPHGLRYLRGVNLVDLLRLAPEHDDVGVLLERFTQTHPGAAIPDILGALAVLVARGALKA